MSSEKKIEEFFKKENARKQSINSLKKSKKLRKQKFKICFEVSYESEIIEFEEESNVGIITKPTITVKKTFLEKKFDEHFLDNFPLDNLMRQLVNKSIHQEEKEFKEELNYLEKHLKNHLVKAVKKLLKQYRNTLNYRSAYDPEEAFEDFIKRLRNAIDEAREKRVKINVANIGKIYDSQITNSTQKLSRIFKTYSIDYARFKNYLRELNKMNEKT